MSIYGSLDGPSDEEHEADCGIWVKHEGGLWEMRDKAACTCGQPDAPLVYQGSSVLPDARTDPRGGWVDIAIIPSHITRDGRDDAPEDEKPWPYLRLGVNEGTVVLTRRNTQRVADCLNHFLEVTEPGGEGENEMG